MRSGFGEEHVGDSEERGGGILPCGQGEVQEKEEEIMVSRDLKEWRRKQPRGVIMKPKTFKSIVDKCEARGGSEESCKKQAGSAYWKTAKKKFGKK